MVYSPGAAVHAAAGRQRVLEISVVVAPDHGADAVAAVLELMETPPGKEALDLASYRVSRSPYTHDAIVRDWLSGGNPLWREHRDAYRADLRTDPSGVLEGCREHAFFTVVAPQGKLPDLPEGVAAEPFSWDAMGSLAP
jgi:hypothetical protein